MEMTVIVKISKEEYKKAVCSGWFDRFGEEIEPEDVEVVDNVDDFQAAVPYFPEGSIKNIQTKK